jgi:hypothetical protein
MHPGDTGFYLSALTHYATLYRQSPFGLTNGAISADVTDDDPVLIETNLAASLQQIAWDTARYFPASGVTAGRFASWAEELPVGQRDWLDQPFTNGLPNLLRWAYGVSVLVADEPERHLFAETAGGSVVIRYRVGTDAEDAGVKIEPQWSTNLAAWFNGLPGGMSTIRTGDDMSISGEVAETNGFLRLLIRRP